MINSEITNEVQSYIELNQISNAIDLLKKFCEEFKHPDLSKELVLLSSRYASNESAFRTGVLKRDNYSHELTSIKKSLLEIMSDISKLHENGFDLDITESYLETNKKRKIADKLPKFKNIKKNIYDANIFRNNPSIKRDYFYYATLSLLSLALIAVSIYAYNKISNYEYTVEIEQFKKSFVKDPGKIEVWNNFQEYLSYYNAPFVFTDEDHIKFKVNLLQKSKGIDPIFKVLFFKGISKEENDEFNLKMEGFRESMKDFIHHNSSKGELITKRVEIKIDTVSNMPKTAFFLSRDENDIPTALVYFYLDKMIERSPSGNRGILNFAVLVKEGEESVFDMRYADFQSKFRESWNSTGNKVISIDDLLKGNY